MRTRELVRRICLLAAVLAAAALVAWPAAAVWNVRTVDFPALQKKRIARFGEAVQTVAREAGLDEAPRIASGHEGDLAAFIARETRDRLETVAGPAWERFFAEVTATLAGRARTLARHLEDAPEPRALTFALDAEPLAELRGRVGDARPFVYVALAGGATPRHLAVNFRRSAAAMRSAPNFLAFPGRTAAAWVLLAGLAVYCFLPRHRPLPQEFRYRQINAAIVPDWLGLVLATMFFVLPILIVSSNASSLRPWSLLDFESGWGVLTLVMWFLALGGVAVIAMALWYATFSLFVLEDRLRRVSLFGEAEYRFADLVAVEPATRELPRWLKGMMLVAGLLRPKLMGTMILGATSAMNGIRIRCRDGRSVNVWFDYLDRPLTLLRHLASHGVPVGADLLEGDWDDEPPAAATPGARRRLAPVAWFAVVGGAAVALALWPEAERRVVPPAPAISPAVHAQQQAVLAEMNRLQPQMKAASTRVDTANVADRKAAVREFEALLGRFRELQRRYNELDQQKYLPAPPP